MQWLPIRIHTNRLLAQCSRRFQTSSTSFSSRVRSTKSRERPRQRPHRDSSPQSQSQSIHASCAALHHTRIGLNRQLSILGITSQGCNQPNERCVVFSLEEKQAKQSHVKCSPSQSGPDAAQQLLRNSYIHTSIPLRYATTSTYLRYLRQLLLVGPLPTHRPTTASVLLLLLSVDKPNV